VPQEKNAKMMSSSRMSCSQLAVAARTARLAAQRALPAEVAELDRQLGRFRAARTASDRRRAVLQFSVGVAAAAQSPRLLREEQRLAAEVGDLPWLQASDADHAEAVAARPRLTAAIVRTVARCPWDPPGGWRRGG
jgi:DNA-binding FadR family transcriptional regulator